jgi:hypothetical protein
MNIAVGVGEFINEKYTKSGAYLFANKCGDM